MSARHGEVLAEKQLSQLKLHHSLKSSSTTTCASAHQRMSIISEKERHTRELWRRADAVAFDVDSTVIMDECIDELAVFKGVGEEVSALTRQAMGGNQSFRHALTTRLDLIRPSRHDIHRYLAAHPPRLTDGIERLVSILHRRGTSVYLVSGGFTRTIEPVASRLVIAQSRVYANLLLFDEQTGEYEGFDHAQPTSESGGKARACDAILRTGAHRCLVMVGDGATDMEASPPAHAAIGFGGNVVRETVVAKAGWFVRSFDELITELN